MVNGGSRDYTTNDVNKIEMQREQGGWQLWVEVGDLLYLWRLPSGHLVPKCRRIDVNATSSRRIDVNTTSFSRHVPAGSSVKTLR